jgi:hypothetical protein
MPINEARRARARACFGSRVFVLVLVVVHAIRRYDFETMGPKTSLQANGREPDAGNEEEHEHGLDIAHEGGDQLRPRL